VFLRDALLRRVVRSDDDPFPPSNKGWSRATAYAEGSWRRPTVAAVKRGNSGPAQIPPLVHPAGGDAANHHRL